MSIGLQIKPWTINDAIVQIDAAMSGLRAGLGGVVVRVVDGDIRLSGEGRGLNLLRTVAGMHGHEIRDGDEKAYNLVPETEFYGHGEGDGQGFGRSDGRGGGQGYGSSNGCGDGRGDGRGDGQGYGSDSGYGEGCGEDYDDDCDNGQGYGSGFGEGCDDGYGDGSGYSFYDIYQVQGDMKDPDKSQPYCHRNDRGGTYLGFIQGPGAIPGTTRMWARHVWSWVGRLGTTAIAKAGPGDGSSVGPWVFVDLPDEWIASGTVATPEAFEQLDRIPVSLERAAG